MPTGRPDYWYGTALYFEDNPADGEVTRGPTSNWAFDHSADGGAHHPKPEDTDVLHVGKNLTSAGSRRVDFYPQGTATRYGMIARSTGPNGLIQIYNNGSGEFLVELNGDARFRVLSTGGVELIWDDTPTNGELTKGVTSDWAFDHKGDASAHHAQYVPEDEAVLDLNANTVSDGLCELALWGGPNEGSKTFKILRYGGATGYVMFANAGSGNMRFNVGGATRFTILPGGGVEEIWDDTPTNGEVTKGLTSDWGFDHKADGSAHHIQSVVYVNRGNVSSADKALGNFTKDGTWRDWDISAIVGAAKRTVLIAVNMTHSIVAHQFGFRQKGMTGTYSNSIKVQLVAGGVQRDDHIVETDSSGVIQYFASATATWAQLEATIRGWWKV